jgi:hypothetical protein
MTSTTLPRAVIFDIDGTLALRGDRDPYAWERVGEDQPNPAVIELAHTIAAAGLHRIIVMSGRDEVCRMQTEMWLDAHGITFDELHMRARKDNRKDSIIKRELYEQHVVGRYDVAFTVDDRQIVVDTWREMGLTCMQVADGDF